MSTSRLRAEGIVMTWEFEPAEPFYGTRSPFLIVSEAA